MTFQINKRFQVHILYNSINMYALKSTLGFIFYQDLYFDDTIL